MIVKIRRLTSCLALQKPVGFEPSAGSTMHCKHITGILSGHQENVSPIFTVDLVLLYPSLTTEENICLSIAARTCAANLPSAATMSSLTLAHTF